MAKIKNKRTLIAIAAFAGVVTLLGGAFALNRTGWSFDNIFGMDDFSFEVSEEFLSPTDWKPCDTTQKTITVKNTGSVSASVRMSLDENWTSADGKPLSLIRNGVRLASFDGIDSNDWTLRDGYYYLNHELAAGASVDFLDSVTFNCNADFGTMDMCDGTGSCKENEDDYNGASYHLIATAHMKESTTPAWPTEDGYVEPQTFSLLRPDFWSVYSGQIVQSKNIYYFLRSSTLASPAAYEMQAPGETPIYMWYEQDLDGYNYGKIYWYSTADAITWNSANYSIGGFFAQLYANGGSIYSMDGLRDFDMHNVTSASGMFSSKTLPDDISAMSHWDLSGVRNWQGVFPSDSSFSQKHLDDLRYWKVSGDMQDLFYNNSGITDLSPLLNWTTTGITSLNRAFSSMSGLKSLHGLENWDVSQVWNFTQTFNNDYNLEDISALANWDVSSATNMPSLFYYCSKIKSIEALRNWDVSNVSVFSGMFYSNYALTTLEPISGWNVSSMTSGSGMFRYATGISDARVLNGWQVPSTASIDGMFDSTACTEATYPTWYTPERRS